MFHITKCKKPLVVSLPPAPAPPCVRALPHSPPPARTCINSRRLPTLGKRTPSDPGTQTYFTPKPTCGSTFISHRGGRESKKRTTFPAVRRYPRWKINKWVRRCEEARRLSPPPNTDISTSNLPPVERDYLSPNRGRTKPVIVPPVWLALSSHQPYKISRHDGYNASLHSPTIQPRRNYCVSTRKETAPLQPSPQKPNP